MKQSKEAQDFEATARAAHRKPVTPGRRLIDADTDPAMKPAESTAHHPVLSKAGYKLSGSRQLGVSGGGPPSMQHNYAHPARKGESVEVYPGAGHSRADVWAHRTAASGVGTGIRPKGGTSPDSLAKHLRSLK